MPKAKIVLRITRSQQMALTDILSRYMQLQDEVQEFIDCGEDVTTTTGELLTLVMDMREIELTQ